MSSYPEWNQFVDVIQIKLLYGIRRSLHFKNISRIHLALNYPPKVLCKLSAVNGCGHKDDLGGKIWFERRTDGEETLYRGRFYFVLKLP